MAAAVLATACRGSVTLDDAGVVAKSYPGFWEDFNSLEREMP
jgi:3-phosphoshikimate 1-carboxyvinyltransferase